MARVLMIVVLLYITNVLAVVPSHPVFLYPEHRSAVRPLQDVEQISTNAYDFQIIPSDQYPLVEYDSSLEASLLELISYPVTALKTVATKALSAVKWIAINGSMVFLGMALVVGFCGFTPYCTLVIEKPLVSELRDLSIPYLDEVEHYLGVAYNKYRAMQNVS